MSEVELVSSKVAPKKYISSEKKDGIDVANISPDGFLFNAS